MARFKTILYRVKNPQLRAFGVVQSSQEIKELIYSKKMDHTLLLRDWRHQQEALTLLLQKFLHQKQPGNTRTLPQTLSS